MKRWQRKVLLASLTGAMWLTAPVSALADVEEGSAAEVQQEVTAGEEIAVQTIQETGVQVAVPVISKMSATVQGIHVYWNKVSGAASYTLFRATSRNGAYTKLVSTSATNYTDTGVKSGTTYFYKVCANAGDSQSAASGVRGMIFVETPDFTLRVNRSVGIGLSWNKIAGATGYAVYRRSYSGSDAWVRVATVTDGSTSWNDTSVKSKNGSIYRYTVRALAGSDRKTLSGCRSTGRTMVRLMTPTLNSADVSGGGKIKAAWSQNAQGSGYELRLMTDGTVYKIYTLGNNASLSKVVADLPQGTTFKVQVRAYKKVSGVGSFYSAWSNEKKVTVEGGNSGSDNSVSQAANDFKNGNYGMMSAAEWKKTKAEIEKFKVKYITSDMSDFEKEIKIIEWLVENCEYQLGDAWSRSTAYSCIVLGKAQCSGYADAFLQTVKLCGLDVRYVHSSTHAWNLVKLDDNWYHVDVTWEDPIVQEDGGSSNDNGFGFENLRNEYINLMDAQIQKVNEHKTWSPSTIKANGIKYGPAVVEKYLEDGIIDTSLAGTEKDNSIVGYKIKYVDEDGFAFMTVSGSAKVGTKITPEKKEFKGYELTGESDIKTYRLNKDEKLNQFTVRYTTIYDWTIRYVCNTDGKLLATQTGTAKAGTKIQIPKKKFDGHKCLTSETSFTVSSQTYDFRVSYTHELDKYQYTIEWYAEDTGEVLYTITDVAEKDSGIRYSYSRSDYAPAEEWENYTFWITEDRIKFRVPCVKKTTVKNITADSAEDESEIIMPDNGSNKADEDLKDTDKEKSDEKVEEAADAEEKENVKQEESSGKESESGEKVKSEKETEDESEVKEGESEIDTEDSEKETGKFEEREDRTINEEKEDGGKSLVVE